MTMLGEWNRRPRARRLVVAVSIALGAAGALTHGTEASATPLAVSNCNDSGSGSLRAAVAAAASGDTIDMTTLICGTITLTSGAITVPQTTLTIDGPGQHSLTIDGYFNDRVLRHTGTGSLSLSDITISDGKYVSNTAPSGGCIYSGGDVSLTDATVSGCILVGQGSTVARGGAVYTKGGLVLQSSTLTGNTVDGTGSPINNAQGGAAVTRSDLIAKYSTISDNRAITIDGHVASSGAFEVFGNFGLASSTVSGNSAVNFGAMGLEGLNNSTASIIESTISGNVAKSFSAIYTQVPTTIVNSTIAFNRATYGRGALYSQVSPIDLESTIIAGNEKTGGGVPDDINGTSNTSVTGANNLVTSSTVPLPSDTITSCPHLEPLANNGGSTKTHALHSDSPAIDNGNNDQNLTVDQRGMDRVNGVAADIGAYEWYGPTEHLFLSGFEPVCDQ